MVMNQNGKPGRVRSTWVLAGGLLLATSLPAAQALYSCDFETAAPGKTPDDFLVLDGAFSVKAEGPNKFLELPGAPVDSYGVLFGPTVSNNVAVAARVYGTNKGRRLPVFGVGLNGAGGLKLMVAPGRQALEILRGDEPLAHAPYQWETGKWTLLRLQLRRLEDGAWQAEGKAWTEGSPEPAGFLLQYKEKSDLPPGKAALWGSPISGTPIRYDDLKVWRLDKSGTTSQGGGLKRGMAQSQPTCPASRLTAHNGVSLRLLPPHPSPLLVGEGGPLATL
jgi:hypothetical protein